MCPSLLLSSHYNFFDICSCTGSPSVKWFLVLICIDFPDRRSCRKLLGLVNWKVANNSTLCLNIYYSLLFSRIGVLLKIVFIYTTTLSPCLYLYSTLQFAFKYFYFIMIWVQIFCVTNCYILNKQGTFFQTLKYYLN